MVVDVTLLAHHLQDEAPLSRSSGHCTVTHHSPVSAVCWDCDSKRHSHLDRFSLTLSALRIPVIASRLYGIDSDLVHCPSNATLSAQSLAMRSLCFGVLFGFGAELQSA